MEHSHPISSPEDLKLDHLIGHPWRYGKDDCYSVVRDFYHDNFGLQLPDFARPNDFWEDPDLNLYIDNFQREGFSVVDVRVRDLRIGDGFLIALYVDTYLKKSLPAKPRTANHAAVYIGDGKILHHFPKRLSNIEAYSGKWQNITVATLRHKEINLTPPSRRVIEYIDLLPPSKRAEIEQILATAPGARGDQGAGGVHPAPADDSRG